MIRNIIHINKTTKLLIKEPINKVTGKIVIKI